LDFKCLYFLEKWSNIFQKSLIKSLIYKIKNIKISRISWQVQIDEIKKKMSKIKKNKKKLAHREILKKKIILHIDIFVKELLQIPEFIAKISNHSNKTLEKKP